MEFFKIQENNKNYENFKNDFHENYKNKSFEICIEEQKTFTIRPTKINISNSRTYFNFWDLIKIHEICENVRKLLEYVNFQKLFSSKLQKLKLWGMHGGTKNKITSHT